MGSSRTVNGWKMRPRCRDDRRRRWLADRLGDRRLVGLAAQQAGHDGSISTK